MKYTSLLLFALLFVSCSEESDIVQTNGTRLVSIESKFGENTKLENYSYSTSGQLIQIENLNTSRSEFEYRDDVLLERNIYSIVDNQLVSRDSIAYNSDGTISEIYRYSIYSGLQIPFTSLYEFEHDIQNNMTKVSVFSISNNSYISIRKYYWEGNNVSRVENFNGGGGLLFESFYQYDDKINYKKGALLTLCQDRIQKIEGAVDQLCPVLSDQCGRQVVYVLQMLREAA